MCNIYHWYVADVVEKFTFFDTHYTHIFSNSGTKQTSVGRPINLVEKGVMNISKSNKLEKKLECRTYPW